MKFSVAMRGRWGEGILSLLAVGTIAGAAACYLGEFSLLGLFMQVPTLTEPTPIGSVKAADGVLKRRRQQGGDFESISAGGAVYDQDLFMTGAGSRARLDLKEGGVLELLPDTLVRIAFESRLSIKGAVRSARVEVARGEVSSAGARGTNAAGSPSLVVQKAVRAPKPTSTGLAGRNLASIATNAAPSAALAQLAAQLAPKLEIVSPAFEEALAWEGGPSSSIPVSLTWKIDRPTAAVQIELVSVTDRRTIFQRKSAVTSIGETVNSSVGAPGIYEWRVTADREKATRRFQVATEARRRLSLTAQREERGERLAWGAWPGIARYRVGLYRTRKDAEDGLWPLHEESVTQGRYLFERGRVPAGNWYAAVSTRVPAGFVVRAEPIPLMIPPETVELKNPADQSTSAGSALLTWQARPLVSGYRVEVSRDADFREIVARSTTARNVYAFSAKIGARYWWRVHALQGAGEPEIPSAVRSFEVRR